MKQSEVKRFDILYAHHLKFLKLQKKSIKTIEAYIRGLFVEFRNTLTVALIGAASGNELRYLITIELQPA